METLTREMLKVLPDTNQIMVVLGSSSLERFWREEFENPKPQCYERGYEWWLMKEARKRNPGVLLEGLQWGAPGWIGNGQFWSQDMCDYYVKWIKGLKSTYGLELDAIGCRNERGAVTSWVKLFRKTLNENGLEKVRVHAFDEFVRGGGTIVAWNQGATAVVSATIGKSSTSPPYRMCSRVTRPSGSTTDR